MAHGPLVLIFPRKQVLTFHADFLSNLSAKNSTGLYYIYLCVQDLFWGILGQF